MELLLGLAAMYVAYRIFGRSSEAWRSDRATKKQLDYLRDLGVDISGRRLTKGEASDLITDATEGEGERDDGASQNRDTAGAEAFGYTVGRAVEKRKLWFWVVCLLLIVLHFVNGGA